MFSSVSRRWRRFRWRIRLRLRQRAEVARATTRLRKVSDERDNAESSLPDGERIDWPCFWIGEVYTPSHASRLINGLKDLGLSSDRAPSRDLVAWVRSSRARPGAWANGGIFSQPGTLLSSGPRIDVPKDFIFLQFGLHQIAAGVTVLTAQFALSDSRRRQLDETMREEFHAEARPLKGGGHSGHYASDLKEARIGELRAELRGVAQAWVTDNLPGSFSSLKAELPVWDMLLSQKESFVEDAPTRRGWRATLGLDSPAGYWRAPDFPGLYLISSLFASDRAKSVETFVGKESELLAEQRENERNTHSLILRTDSAVAGVLAAWTVEKLLSQHEERFAQIRDDLAGPEYIKAWRAGRRLRRIRREVLPLTFDLETLERGAQDERAITLLGYSSETDFDWVSRREGAERTLMQMLGEELPKRGAAVADTARDIASALRIQGEFLLATSNLRLQWAVIFLTVLAAAAGVFATLSAGGS